MRCTCNQCAPRQPNLLPPDAKANPAIPRDQSELQAIHGCRVACKWGREEPHDGGNAVYCTNPRCTTRRIPALQARAMNGACGPEAHQMEFKS